MSSQPKQSNIVCANPMQPLSTTDSSSRPFVQAAYSILDRALVYKGHARAFYFEVVLSAHQCPACAGQLVMTGISRCTCEACGASLDPTEAFQRSPCCGAELQKRTSHYACTGCGRMAPSLFLFDERVFDSDYFARAMQSYRERAQRRREEVQRLLANSRSNTLPLDQDIHLESIPGLLTDLDSFLGANLAHGNHGEKVDHPFDLQRYRTDLLEQLGQGRRLFGSFLAITDQERSDRVYRFVALVFLEQEGEVALTQNGPGDIWVERVCHEIN